jgi:hypothetical protein
MRRTQLACVIAALLALAGPAAGPVRTVDSTRLIASLTWPGDPTVNTRETAPQTTALFAPPVGSAVAGGFATSDSSPIRTPRIEHSLFQRPPPPRY